MSDDAPRRRSRKERNLARTVNAKARIKREAKQRQTKRNQQKGNGKPDGQ